MDIVMKVLREYRKNGEDMVDVVLNVDRSGPKPLPITVKWTRDLYDLNEKQLDIRDKLYGLMTRDQADDIMFDIECLLTSKSLFEHRDEPDVKEMQRDKLKHFPRQPILKKAQGTQFP